MSLPHHRYFVNTTHTKWINTTIANFVDTYQVFKTCYQFWFISILFTNWPITNDHQEGVSTMNSYQSVSANFIHGSIPRHISCIKLFLYLIVKIFSKVRSVHLLHVRSGEERCAKQTWSGKIYNSEKKKKASEQISFVLVTLILYTLTSVCINSILFSIHFQRSWEGEFVLQSRGALWWSSSLFSRLLGLIQGWYCKEKLDAGHS